MTEELDLVQVVREEGANAVVDALLDAATEAYGDLEAGVVKVHELLLARAARKLA